MDLTEIEGKAILEQYGIHIPKGMEASTLDQVQMAIEKIGLPLMMKSQVRIGGRGKAGGIKVAHDEAEAKGLMSSLLSLEIKGLRPKSLLLEERLPFKKEYYLAISMDRAAGLPVLLFSLAGGMDVESSASGSISRYVLDVPGGIGPEIRQDIREKISGNAMEVDELLDGLWQAFWQMDCTLLEINPLFQMANGELIAGDAKVSLDDDALFRHPDYLMEEGSGTLFESECKKAHLNGVQLDGEIAVVANGAGLTMAVLDEIAAAGMTGACFLDMGGTDDPAVVEKAIMISTDRMLLPGLRCAFVCIFGGITRCDVVAQGIVQAVENANLDVPLVVRMRGVNEERGREMLIKAGIHSDLDIGICIETIKRVRTA